MGRPSGTAAQRRQLANTLRVELQRQIERGQCAYCRAPARPNQPLTREHVIPRARGGGRKDIRIIVPACARCNHHRGCAELIPFLLSRPRRISSFLDYLGGLSQESIRQLDARIFAELYTATAILIECAAHGAAWRGQLARLCTGRALHRRRYAARRAMSAVSERVGSRRDRDAEEPGPGCLIPMPRSERVPLHLDEPLERLASRVLSVLALLWEVSAESAEREMLRELGGTAIGGDSLNDRVPVCEGVRDEGILALDGWRVRPKRKRLRVDRRRGRTARPARGRAA